MVEETHEQTFITILGMNARLLSNAAYEVIWCGDLNNDNLPDIIIRDFWHYNIVESVKLFLSGGKQRPVEPAATFMAVGC